ncbi:aquaporin-3-like [Actinia tenebrosa]|uniref:Aquaporin-3-like n=1 Tax=Actinia tenebrosa TaxID=6105 RepID=A0A6P8H420_ACTTE|nr:aquaporin-3-like [Actinia tenebrosa]XP_031550197.1 aquaporin-3-like [Actinia tenebrosa]
MASLPRCKAPEMLRLAIAELLATFILVTFGCGSIAQMVLSRETKGTFFSVNFSWGIGITLGCYWAGGISGAHMNPAVTLAFAVARKLCWTKVPVYWLAQLSGAFFASACVYGVYLDALDAFDGGVRQITGPNATAGIWATYPQEYLSIRGGFGDQVFGTFLLVGCIFAILDKNNNAPHKGVAPILIGLTVFIIGATFGLNCGYAINPARDLGPRIFTAMAGWGGGVFTAHNNWSWVPVVACLLGGVAGGLFYMVLIELQHDSDAASGDSESFEDIEDESGNINSVNVNKRAEKEGYRPLSSK